MLYELVLKAAVRFPSWSRPLFGTDASMAGVIKGYAALRSHRRHAPIAVAERHRTTACTMEHEGFAALGKPYDDELLRQIAARFEALTSIDAAWKFRYESSGDIHSEKLGGSNGTRERGRLVQRDLIDPSSQIPDVNRLLDPRTIELVESCYRTHFRLVRIAYWRNYHVPSDLSEQQEVGYSHYWHHDGHAIDTLKLFVVMSDVTEDDGPFHVVSKAESRRIVRHAFDRKQAKHGKGPLAQLQPFKLTGPRGTAALCNTTLCLHRAGIPAAGRQRDLLQFQFVSSPKPFTSGTSPR